MVREALVSRSTKRSSAAAASGSSRTSWTGAVPPGAVSSPSSTIRAPTSAAAWCSRTGCHIASGFVSEGSTVTSASIRRVGA
ncbi:hypothetical protein BTHI11S_04138 [Bosea thiooxidans]